MSALSNIQIVYLMKLQVIKGIKKKKRSQKKLSSSDSLKLLFSKKTIICQRKV